MNAFKRMIDNIGIHGKIRLILFIPLTTMLTIAGYASYQKLLDKQALQSFTDLTQLTILSGNLVHENQAERARSVIYLALKSNQTQRDMVTQRVKTDREIKTFEKILANFDLAKIPPLVASAIEQATTQIKGIRQIRQGVDNHSASLEHAIHQYTDLNLSLIHISTRMVSATTHARLSLQTAAYERFLQFKEHAGQERSLLSAAFSANTIPREEYALFISSIAKQDGFLETFLTLSPPPVRQRVNRALHGKAWQEDISKMRKALIDSTTMTGFDVDPERWFQASSAKINEMHKLETEQAKSLLAQTKIYLENGQKQLIWNIAPAIGALFFTFFFSRYIAKDAATALSKTVRVIEQLAAGDLSPRLNRQSKDEIGQMAVSLNVAMDKLSDLLSRIKRSANTVASSSQEVNDASSYIASSSDIQAEQLQQTARHMQEITDSVKLSEQSASTAVATAHSAREVAEEGGSISQQAVASMVEIGDASSEIADINSTINEIAFQTNLLALNAAVEAARAGEAGRGFAVVANEVRSLAGRASEAAKRIEGLIDNSVKKVSEGKLHVDKAGNTLSDIVDSVRQVEAIISDISRASEEQSASVTQINTSITAIGETTGTNAEQTKELTATSQTLSQQAYELNKMVEQFNLKKA